MPVSERSQHVAKGNSNRNYTHVLPVVSVRDPYTWLQSMYVASFFTFFPLFFEDLIYYSQQSHLLSQP